MRENHGRPGQVLILGGPQDRHAQLVYEAVAARGAAVDYLDFSLFPAKLTISYRAGVGEGHLRLPSGKLLGFNDVQAVYWRNFNKPSSPSLPDPEQAYIAENDGRSLIETLLEELPARWVNGWEGYRLHQRKPAALSRVARLGVRIPKTLVGNDAQAVRQFVAESGPCIFKPVQGGAHTRRLSPQHMSDDNLAKLALAPVTLQEEIPGTNVRVFVAGEKVMACEVATEAIDFRDDRAPTMRPYPLTPSMADQCRQIATALALVWTGIDFRVTPEGEWFFLEANPSPMFYGFEAVTGLPLLAALTDLLVDD